MSATPPFGYAAFVSRTDKAFWNVADVGYWLSIDALSSTAAEIISRSIDGESIGISTVARSFYESINRPQSFDVITDSAPFPGRQSLLQHAEDVANTAMRRTLWRSVHLLLRTIVDPLGALLSFGASFTHNFLYTSIEHAVKIYSGRRLRIHESLLAGLAIGHIAAVLAGTPPLPAAVRYALGVTLEETVVRLVFDSLSKPAAMQ